MTSIVWRYGNTNILYFLPSLCPSLICIYISSFTFHGSRYQIFLHIFSSFLAIFFLLSSRNDKNSSSSGSFFGRFNTQKVFSKRFFSSNNSKNSFSGSWVGRFNKRKVFSHENSWAGYAVLKLCFRALYRTDAAISLCGARN